MLLESIVAFMISALAFGVLAAGVFGGIRADQTPTLYQEALSLARSHLSGAEAGTLNEGVQTGDDGNGFTWTVRVATTKTVSLPSSPLASRLAFATQATLYDVSVTEFWRADGQLRHIRLDTARVESGPASAR